MAKNSIRDYSATNSSNTDIQSIDISEGCSPAGINNAIREVMADLKDVSTGTVALESPAADSLTVTGDLTVDTSTLKVDSTNNRVGIVNASPTTALDVTGDITVSGGVYLGGTGSANYLDDYEEGTFTPAYQSVTGGSWTYSTQTGYYTKVGNMVHVHGQISTSAGSGLTGTIQINLPFASVQSTPGPILVNNLDKTTDADIVTLTVSSNLRVYEFRNNTVYTTRGYADLGPAHSIFFNVTYRV